MNGNDYVEIECDQAQQIVEDYIKDVQDGKVEVPEDYKTKWIDLFLEGE